MKGKTKIISKIVKQILNVTIHIIIIILLFVACKRTLKWVFGDEEIYYKTEIKRDLYERNVDYRDKNVDLIYDICKNGALAIAINDGLDNWYYKTCLPKDIKILEMMKSDLIDANNKISKLIDAYGEGFCINTEIFKSAYTTSIYEYSFSLAEAKLNCEQKPAVIDELIYEIQNDRKYTKYEIEYGKN